MKRSDVAGIAAVVAVAAVLRFSFAIPGVWQEPWTPHHFDEHILPFEALALWEGVAPREVGWPASTFRLLLSGVYGGQLIADEAPALGAAGNPAEAMGVVARWSGERVADPAPLYTSGRLLSALIGILLVVAAMAAARAWTGAGASVVGGALAALSPLAVSHSQLLLADVSGAFFATWMLALVPGLAEGRRSPVGAGLLAGLAAASKVHFGLWLFVPLAACWIGGSAVVRPLRLRLETSAVLLLIFALTMTALVPWLWTDPVLALKEFAGVVLVKAGSGRDLLSSFSTGMRLLSVLGAAVLVGAALGVRPLWQAKGWLGGVLIAVTGLALVALSGAAIVFDRYSLVLLPGATLAGAAGWHALRQRFERVPPWAMTVVILLLGLPQAIAAVDEFRRTNSYHDAHAWMSAHLPDGASVAIYSEDNQPLARHPVQLAECAAYAWSESAYREKWKTNDVAVSEGSGLPMHRAIVNDELFHAFWCAREALAPKTPSFFVRRFHASPRFQTLDLPTLEHEFREGLDDRTRGFDAVLVHWELFPDLAPARVFETAAGPRLRLYLRPGLTLRSAPGAE